MPLMDDDGWMDGWMDGWGTQAQGPQSKTQNPHPHPQPASVQNINKGSETVTSSIPSTPGHFPVPLLSSPRPARRVIH